MKLSKFKEKLVVKQKNHKISKHIGRGRQTWFGKHNKKIAIIFALLVSSIILVVVVTSEEPSLTTASSGNGSRTTQASFGAKSEEGPCTLQGARTVTCTGAGSQNLEDYINSCTHEVTGKIDLQIVRAELPGGRIGVGWLGGLNKKLSSLTISNTPIDDIEECALASHPFDSLKTIGFVDTGITHLRKHFFRDVALVEKLYFTYAQGQEVKTKVEEGALEYLHGSIANLQIDRILIDGDHVRNLFGRGVELLKLILLDLSHNRIEELLEDSFVQVPNVQSMYLLGNVIRYIHVNAFNNLRGLKLLHLNNNGLKSLPDGVFSFIELFGLRNVNIHLESNSFICNCSLEWLKEMYMTTNHIYRTDPPYCQDQNVDIEFARFNCNETTVKPSTLETTPPTTTPTLGEIATGSVTNPEVTSEPSRYPHPVTRIKCRDFLSSPVYVDSTLKRNELERDILVQNKSLGLKLYEVEQEPVIVELEIVGNIAKYHLIWFNSEEFYGTCCMTNLSNRVPIYNLTRGATYTMCLMADQEISVSPYDCFSLNVPKAWEKQALILNESKATLIGVGSGLLIAIMIITGTIVYICIRKNPKLIKGSKKIVIVKKIKPEEAVVIPEQYDKPIYVSPSSTNLTIGDTSGYLTPRNHRYARIKYRPPFIRSVSEIGSYSSIPYINDDGREGNSENWGMRRNAILEDIISVDDLDLEDDYANIPPLPPPNRNGRQTFSQIYSIS